MSRPNYAARALIAVAVTVLAIGGAVAIVTQIGSVNPPASEVKEKLEAAGQALEMLGERRSALGYSFRIPEGFERGRPPPNTGLPRGSDTYSWTAPEDSEDAGSFLHLIVIPKKSDIRKELQKLDQVGAQTAFPARISSKSSYRRIGDDNLVGVRGLLEGIRENRPGIVYFIADGRKTLIIIGAGDGKNGQNVQYLLDHAVRTIRRASR